MCNKHKAPTGTSDDATFVKECISLAKDLGDKEHKGLAGGSDSEDGDEDEDDNDDDNEEDDEVEAEELVRTPTNKRPPPSKVTLERVERREKSLVSKQPQHQKRRIVKLLAPLVPAKGRAKGRHQSSRALARA